MKKYTKAEFDALPRNEFGFKVCPTGDYSDIKDFGEECIFGHWCSFSEESIFGHWCRFGECCIFCRSCRFGEDCSFGKSCRFGECCSFGRACSFGEWCVFGKGCRFGRYCSFGEYCSFGKECSFEGGDVKNGRYIGIDRIGSELRKAYFFIDENGTMFVRAGCWFGSLADFKERVKEEHGGTKYEKQYLAACDFAELMLKG